LAQLIRPTRLIELIPLAQLIRPTRLIELIPLAQLIPPPGLIRLIPPIRRTRRIALTWLAQATEAIATTWMVQRIRSIVMAPLTGRRPLLPQSRCPIEAPAIQATRSTPAWSPVPRPPSPPWPPQR
jgi:hypothetical protein